MDKPPKTPRVNLSAKVDAHTLGQHQQAWLRLGWTPSSYINELLRQTKPLKGKKLP